uniref:Peptidase S1 domain-containing protein n=1 Tax=Meloidogyne hapla TaxID=6305 RepID=A0A1I8C232_MELHA
MEFNFSIVILFCFLILITTNTIIEVNAVPADRLTNNEGASFDRATEIELLAKSNNGWSKSEEKFGTFQKGGVPSSFVKEEFVENNKKEEKGEEKNIKNGQRQQQNGNLEQNPLKVLENYFEIVERNPPRSTFENLNLLSHCSGVYVGNTNGNPNTDVTYYRQSGIINNNSSIRRSRNVLALQYGSNAESHEIQWFAQIFNTTALGHNYRCGGAAIHRRFIVTSAHCFKSTNADDIIVKIGSKKLFEGGHIQILKIIRHKIEDIAFCLLTPQLNLKILLIYRKEENVNSKSETSTVSLN